MGKVTYKRVIVVPTRSKIVATLPIFGASLFLIGSALFWPTGKNGTDSVPQDRAAAACFLVGSILYLAQPLADCYDLNCNVGNLVDADKDKRVRHWWNWWFGDSTEDMRKDPDYEFLYKSQILRIQGLNAGMFVLGAICFVIGSIFFFPYFQAYLVHGGWLYIVGCVVVMLGAFVSAMTAHELRKTAQQIKFGESYWELPWWSDEAATIVSCSLYMGGNGFLIVGCVFYFPTIIAYGGVDIKYTAVIHFLIGSLLFMKAATIDFLVLYRDGTVEEPTHEKTTLIKTSKAWVA